ncbi:MULTISPECIES: TetR/AcrR family transcriptional regulator [unclassified Pseudoalteromonas]|uniref:TetR/AcrR family transcriptional regulator n=1 Tax=unclassified Pseudoalteromonas TaxID=194690 RepID=UPI003014C19F
MRTADFDKVQVLRNAMHVFMRYGYNQASMPKLTAATRLHPGSIYCAFKNKKGLLLEAINQYQIDRLAHYKALFADCSSLQQALTHFLADLVKECLAAEAKQVCLLTKTLHEIGESEPEVQAALQSHLHQFEALIQQQFVTHWPKGTALPSPEATNKARLFVVNVYGLRAYAVTNQSPEILQQLAEQIVLQAIT